MSHQPQRRRRRRRNPRAAAPQTSAAEQTSTAEQGEPAGGEPSAPPAAGKQPANRGRGGGRGGSAPPPRRTIFGLPRMSFAILAGLLVAMIAMFGMQIAFPPSEVTEISGVASYPDQGRRHLGEGESFDNYNSSPPTSGPHHDLTPAAGIYGAEQPPPFNEIPDPVEMLPLLESGGVVVYYDPDHSVAGELLPWLQQLTRVRLNLSAVPVNGLADLHDGAPIVAAAWRTLLPLPSPEDDDADDDEPPVYRSLLEVFLTGGEEGYYERYVLDRGGRQRLAANARGE